MHPSCLATTASRGCAMTAASSIPLNRRSGASRAAISGALRREPRLEDGIDLRQVASASFGASRESILRRKIRAQTRQCCRYDTIQIDHGHIEFALDFRGSDRHIVQCGMDVVLPYVF